VSSAPQAEHAIGIDLGGTRIKTICLRTADGEIVAQDQSETRDGESPSGGTPAFAESAATTIREYQTRFGISQPPIGVSAPGLASRDARCIAYMPGRLAGLENFDWGEFLGRPGQIPVINDAHAALLGEISRGAAQGYDDVILITLGTGVGGAIVSGGRLLRGAIGRAGHLGHLTTDFRGPADICGTPGSLEDAIGFCTLERRSGGRFHSTTELVEAAESGDAAAQEIWETSIRALAASIASLVNTLDPAAVIIGGGIAEAGAALFGPLDSILEEYEWRPAGHRVRVLPAKLGEWAGAVGAAHLAQNPNDY